MTLPARLPSKPKRTARIRCPAHLKWVRKHFCCVPDCDRRPIEAAHIRLGSGAGIGQKPDDNRVISLCAHHHRVAHTVGEDTAAKLWGFDLQERAAEFAAKSPYRDRLRRP